MILSDGLYKLFVAVARTRRDFDVVSLQKELYFLCTYMGQIVGLYVCIYVHMCMHINTLCNLNECTQNIQYHST